MLLVGEFVPSYTTYRQVALAPLGRKVWLFRVLGLLFFLLAFPPLFAGASFTRPSLPILFCGIFFLVAYDLLVALGWRQMRKVAERLWRYEISDSSIGIHTLQTDVTVRWDGISKARISPHAWVLRLVGTRKSLAIPRAAFSAEDQTQVDQFIKARYHR
ncbi:MAG: hypothetical protein DLM55_04385 [Acidimicrobiales bacterium]|nr:MAG: hypothetical protein DLM55_04385 [Acidimicrobiales bacterium]